MNLNRYTTMSLAENSSFQIADRFKKMRVLFFCCCKHCKHDRCFSKLFAAFLWLTSMFYSLTALCFLRLKKKNFASFAVGEVWDFSALPHCSSHSKVSGRLRGALAKMLLPKPENKEMNTLYLEPKQSVLFIDRLSCTICLLSGRQIVSVPHGIVAGRLWRTRIFTSSELFLLNWDSNAGEKEPRKESISWFWHLAPIIRYHPKVLRILFKFKHDWIGPRNLKQNWNGLKQHRGQKCFLNCGWCSSINDFLNSTAVSVPI